MTSKLFVRIFKSINFLTKKPTYNHVGKKSEWHNSRKILRKKSLILKIDVTSVFIFTLNFLEMDDRMRKKRTKKKPVGW